MVPGEREGADNVCIWGARMDAKGVWGKSRRITPDNGIPHWNPVLFRREDGTLVLISYGHWEAGEPAFILAIHLHPDEFDAV